LAMSRPIVETVCIVSSSESWEPSTAPTSLALSCRWRSRPQHHSTTITSNATRSAVVTASRWRQMKPRHPRFFGASGSAYNRSSSYLAKSGSPSTRSWADQGPLGNTAFHPCESAVPAPVAGTRAPRRSPAAGSGGTSAPNQNQPHAGHAKQPCSRRQQSSHGVVSFAISDIGERCEAEGI
jgi:hypothetical protein